MKINNFQEIGIRKYKEVNWSKDKGIAIPVTRKDGKQDFLTIEMIDNIIYLNNRYMGARLEIIKDGDGDGWKSPLKIFIQ